MTAILYDDPDYYQQMDADVESMADDDENGDHDDDSHDHDYHHDGHDGHALNGLKLDFWQRFSTKESKGDKFRLFKDEIIRLIQIDSSDVKFRRLPLDNRVNSKIASIFKEILVQGQSTGYVRCNRKDCVVAYRDPSYIKNLRAHSNRCKIDPSPPLLPKSSSSSSSNKSSTNNHNSLQLASWRPVQDYETNQNQAKLNARLSASRSSFGILPASSRNLIIPSIKSSSRSKESEIGIRFNASEAIMKAFETTRSDAYQKLSQTFAEALTSFRHLIDAVERSIAENSFQNSFIESLATFLVKQSKLTNGLKELVMIERRTKQTMKANLLDELLFLVNKHMTVSEERDLNPKDLKFLFSFLEGQFKTFQSLSFV